MDPDKAYKLLTAAGSMYIGGDVEVVLDELARTLTDHAGASSERTYARVRLGLEGLKNHCERYALQKASEYGGSGR